MNKAFTSRSLLANVLQVFAIILLWLPLSSSAGEDALYGPVAPPGSAFIRVFNASAIESIDASAAELKMTDVASMAASDYSFLAPGDLNATVGGTPLTGKLAPNKHYTLVFLGEGLAQLVEDAYFENRKKALISFYNFTDAQPLTLKTADGKVAVVSNTASGQRGERMLNAVKLGMSVFAGTAKVGDIAPYVLERGKVSSLFALGHSSAPVFVWIEG
ncbi:MAG: alginate O-acetyltransferase AlgF [Hahellaceae bacterium]|nr:alginate O-acetyltransferase AlgF [Hahellaceae bacterium]MCP5168314.1 alginate O-acetyltransferase AlgF [Hahellaceae bacterium]